MLPSIQDAVSAAEAGDLSTACNLLDQCIQKETDPAALFQAALCYRSADRVNDALSLLKTLEDRGQTQPPALLLRADIFCSLDRHQHALPLYKTLAEIEHAPMQYSAALGLFNCGDISACLTVIAPLTDNPDPTLAAQAKLLKGRALAANEAFDLAVDSLNQVVSPPAPQALRRAPNIDSPGWRSIKVNLLRRNGRFDSWLFKRVRRTAPMKRYCRRWSIAAKQRPLWL